MQIKINRLSLENFKCHRHLDLALDGKNASIYGDNATGKTSVYDALTWLLFGKDSLGNTDTKVDIKPLDSDGSVLDHRAITSVKAELDVDGTTMTLQRSVREKWSTRRGSSESVFDGNESSYEIDGVPMKKNAFDAKIKERLPEDVFRMLTSVDYLPSQLPWQKRRAVLFDMAGTMTDRQIMEKDPRFQPLLEGMGGLDLPSYRTKLNHERKGFASTSNEAPARLSELQRSLDVIHVDFDAERKELDSLDKYLDGIKEEILSIDHNAAVDQLRMDLREVDQDIRDLNARNDEYRREHDASRDLLDLRKALRDANYELDRKQQDLLSLHIRAKNISEDNARAAEFLKHRLQDMDKETERLRGEWVEIDKMQFTGGKCPVCGQDLPADQLMAAQHKFQADQKAKLDFIIKKADSIKQEREQLKLRAIGQEPVPESKIKELEDACKEAEQKAAAAADRLRAAEDARTMVPPDMEGYKAQLDELQAKRDGINRKVTDLVTGTGDRRVQLEQKARDIGAQIRSKQTLLSLEDEKARITKRMEEIREDQRNASAAMEAIDQMLFLCEEYTRYKAQFVEDGVNSMFRLARFRLFREQANGGLEERCDVTFNGVPYDGLNNGMRINVGIDIINALSRYHSVSVPLFIDNAESVTNLLTCDSQTIRLVVSEKDKELRIV